MSSVIKVHFIASPTSASETRFVEDGRTIAEYLSDVEGLSSTKNITVEIDNEVATHAELHDQEIYDGMTVSISQKKTDSGLRI